MQAPQGPPRRSGRPPALARAAPGRPTPASEPSCLAPGRRGSSSGKLTKRPSWFFGTPGTSCTPWAVDSPRTQMVPEYHLATRQTPRREGQRGGRGRQKLSVRLGFLYTRGPLTPPRCPVDGPRRPEPVTHTTATGSASGALAAGLSGSVSGYDVSEPAVTCAMTGAHCVGPQRSPFVQH